jgi:1-aminocyclopropane-1-carboxylate deaminase/D-cysteine desulfhydrase-like pyridoxal-dependent ACC family enzyme
VSRPPRVPLAALPTPLQRAERLERALGAPPLYLKRDDLTGFALAGNKARQLELLVGEAAALGCDSLVTGGGPGSNFCQAAAAAARVAGLRCVLVLYGRESSPPSTNLALARAFGAEVRFTGRPERESVDPALEAAAAELEATGCRPYRVPRGGATAVGAAGYALAVAELAAQLETERVTPELLVVATGSGGTQAGLVAGTLAGGHRWRVVGAAVSRPVTECAARVLALARGAAALLGLPAPAAGQVEVHDVRGPGYGIASIEGGRAAGLAAATEGLLLDPVFSAKALGLLARLVAEGAGGPLVFWHTGGIPAALAQLEGSGPCSDP